MEISKNDNLVPAICRIYFIPVSDVVSIEQNAGTDRFSKKITLSGSKAFTQLYITPGSAELIEKQKSVDAGEQYEQSLKVIFPGDHSSNALSFDALAGRPLIIMMYYSSAYMKIMGDIGNGARMLRNQQVSLKAANHTLEFSCIETDPMGYVSALANIVDQNNGTGGGID